MNPSSGTREVFMSIPLIRGPTEQSFEEHRIEDYIKAYSTTGRPPAPCPPEPTGEHERVALNLPPLFQPYVEIAGSDTAAATPDTTLGSFPDIASVVNVNPERIPDAQVFYAAQISGEFYQSIACQSGYTDFCHEELRYYAYLKGNIYSPTPIPLKPPPPPPLSLGPAPKLSLGFRPPTPPSNPQEQILSISAAPDYLQHSVEELRVAFLQAGRELTSAEIFQRSPLASLPPSLSRSSLFSGSGGGAFSRSPLAPPF